MKKLIPLTRAASIAAGLLAFSLMLTLSGCGSTPPDDVVKQGIEKNVQLQALRANPFAANGQSKMESYKITNTYKKGETIFYEYEAEVTIDARLGGLQQQQKRTLRGTEAFQKVGNRWESQEML